MTTTIDNGSLSPIKLSLAVLMECIKAQPIEDRQDLMELSEILFSSEDEEERASAVRAMIEIFTDEPMTVTKKQMPDEPSSNLREWIEFVSKRIIEFRTEKGLTQAELSEKTGLPQSHISRLETGKHSPAHSTLVKIAEALEIDVAKLDPSA